MNFKLLFLIVFQSIFCLGQSHKIVITEIFADPTPSKGLPLIEYIEIYNTTLEDINLKNHKLIYGNFSSTFPDYILKSNSYAIVLRKGYEEEFRVYGEVIALNSFSLTNDGMLLILKDQLGQDIFHVDYKSAWHNLTNDGGISLELIDTELQCSKKENWESSLNKIGGTPGKENSIKRYHLDIKAPSLLNFSLDVNEIKLNFDEDLSIAFLNDKANFKIVNGINEVLEIKYDKYEANTAILKLKYPVEEGESVDLMIGGLEDCSGNKAAILKVVVSNLVPAQKNEILISEILFNPKVGGDDFVELFNNSDKLLSLKDWKLAKLNSKNEFIEMSEIANFDLLIQPKSYLAFTKNKKYLEESYPKSGEIVEISKMPSFNNDEGTVILLNKDSVEFDRFFYSEKMHNQMLINPEGISLERTSFDLSKKALWTSTSNDFGFATPGSQNSQFITENIKNVFFVDPIVFNPYDSNINSTIFLKYNLNGNGYAAKVDIIDKNGRLVRNLSNNIILGSSGEIEWNGLSNSGQLLPVGYYIFSIKLYSSKIKEDYLVKCVIGSK